MNPKARVDHLLVQEVEDEVVVYDRTRHEAHRLNRTAAHIWLACDGNTSIAQLAKLVGGEESLVWGALGELDKAHLLAESLPANRPAFSGKQMLGIAAGLAILAPVVETLLAPTPAVAFSF